MVGDDVGDWVVPVLVSAGIQEAIKADIRYADTFFTLETRRLRKLYSDSGNPHLTYLCGRGLVNLGRSAGIQGSIGFAILEITLAEMLIAGGASSADLDLAELHLNHSRSQLEKSGHTELISHILGQRYMMLSVAPACGA